MARKIRKIQFFGEDDSFGLCSSYLRAARKAGYETDVFEYQKEIFGKSRWNFLKRRLVNWIDVEIWQQQLNRKFLVRAKELRPDLIVNVTNSPLRASSLMFLRSILPETKFVLLWPDSLANLKSHVLLSAPLYDFVASYGKAGLASFRRAGFKRAVFVPLAGDVSLHWQKISTDYDIDISFVGGWRPERERALALICRKFPMLKLKVVGPSWVKLCEDKRLRNHCVDKPLYAGDLARFFQRSRININVIDDTNYPSANMRFFEIPTAGGLQISTACPEMIEEFRDREHLVYVNDMSDLEPAIRWALDNPVACDQIRHKSQNLIKSTHNYDARLSSIIKDAEQLEGS